MFFTHYSDKTFSYLIGRLLRFKNSSVDVLRFHRQHAVGVNLLKYLRYGSDSQQLINQTYTLRSEYPYECGLQLEMNKNR